MFFQESGQGLQGAAPVADAVFLGGSHLGKRLAKTIWYKNRVVAKTLFAGGGLGNGAGNNAIELVHLPIQNQGDGGAELCSAVGFTLQVL